MSVYACNPSRRKAFKAVHTNTSSFIDLLTNFEPFPVSTYYLTMSPLTSRNGSLFFVHESNLLAFFLKL